MFQSNNASLRHRIANLDIEALPLSPVKHIRFRGFCGDFDKETRRLEQVVAFAQENGLALTVARYLDQQEYFRPKPSIRVTINVKLTEQEIDFAVDLIDKAFQRFASY